MEKMPQGMVDRVFAVLSAFDDRNRALRLSQLAHRAGLPANTTLRLARSLVSAGALERDEDGAYVVGLRLFEIAALAPRAHGLRRVAMPFLEDLHAAVGQHVLLTVRNDDEAVLVERLSVRGAPPVRYRIGGRLPLDCTGAGLVLLAYAPEGLQCRFETESTPKAKGQPLFARKQLRGRLAEIRATGTLALRPRPPVRLATAAAAVRVDEQVVAAVSVVADAAAIDVGAALPAVVTVAHSISRALRA